MEMLFINPVDYHDWNHQVMEFDQATIFHTSNWAQVLSKTYGYQPKYFCAFDQGKLINAIPLMEINSFITGKRGVSLPFSDQVDILAKEQSRLEEMFQGLVDFARQSRWKKLSFRGDNDYFDGAPACGKYISSHIALNENPDVLFKTFKSSTRRNIRKAIKSGVTAGIHNSQESIDEFYRLNCLSRRDHGLPPQPYAFFKRIYQEIIEKEMGFVCLGTYENKVIAGVMFLMFDNKAVYKFGASEKKYLSLRPNNLVFWEAIKHALEKGARVVDLGRTELHHKGLLQFKRGWNSIETELRYYNIDIPSGRFIAEKNKIKSSYTIFNKLPIPILKTMGKLVYRHIG